MRDLVAELDYAHEKVVVLCDNQSAIHLAKHQVFHEMSKPIDVRLHFVLGYREHWRSGDSKNIN